MHAAGFSTFESARSLSSGGVRHHDADHEHDAHDVDHEHHDCHTADIAQLLDTVHLLESAAIAGGAAELTPQQLRRAHDLNAELRVSDAGAAARLARRFHETLLWACPNARMLELLGHEVAAATACGLPFAAGDAELDRAAAGHAVILEMIAAGAAPRDLERSLRQHAQTSPLCSMGY